MILYQHCLQLTREFSQVYGKDVDFVHRDFLSEDFRQYYTATLPSGNLIELFEPKEQTKSDN